MSPADRRDAAHAAALRLLAARERSAIELRRRLAAKGYDRETVIAALDRLQASGLQDDERFAASFADAAVARRMAPGLIQRKLRGRGVTAELAARASVADPAEEESRARAAAAKRAAALGSLPADKARRRLADFLVRRGYPADLSLRIAEESFPGGPE